jgi:predicted nuclease with TOPRIM domain
MEPDTPNNHRTFTSMTAMATDFSKQALIALARSGQRAELEGDPTISEVKGQIVRLRKQMDTLQREAREHDEYLDRLHGEFQEADELLPRPVVMLTQLAAEIGEAEFEEASFQERLGELWLQKTDLEELVRMLYQTRPRECVASSGEDFMQGQVWTRAFGQV